MRLLRLVPLMLLALATSSGYADSRSLSDEQLDKITAGTASDHELPTTATGGNIIAGDASASIAGNAIIDLRDNAQLGARGLSLVNSADSAVASGVNLWDGGVQTLNVGSEINVLQSNELLQESTSPYAWLLGYGRDESWLRDVYVSADSAAEPETIEFGLHLDIDGIGRFDGAGEAPASVIPTAKIPGSYGNVIGFAGELGVEYDGGSFNARFDLNSSVAAEARLSAEAESSILWGLIEFLDARATARTRVSGSFNPYIELGMVLPDLSILGEGAVCYANDGVCKSSVLDRTVAELFLPVARAEHIVVDRSRLDASSSYGVDLSAEAQASARAVTLVNAAGGLVANGANLATASDLGFGTETEEPTAGSALATDILFLDQDNLVQQTRGNADGSLLRREPSTVGGAIVALESSATMNDTRSVTATDAAQDSARAVTLANSADALVATGVNVWDGRLREAVIGNRVDIDQQNQLLQHDSMTSAGFVFYERGPESMYHAWTDTTSVSEPPSLGIDFSLEIPGLAEDAEPIASLTGDLDVPASIIPTTKIPGLGGTTAAFAGNVDVYLDGGTANFDFGVRESGLHFLTENVTIGGGSLVLIDVDAAGWYNHYTGITIDAGLDLDIVMPDLDVEVDGAACFAQDGTCKAGVTDRDLGRLDIAHANAEYIVLDRSSLDAATTSEVMLDNGAQANARAVNLFNAAGGWIAGGTNIASWRGEEMLLDLPLVNLLQANDVVQTPGVMGRFGAPGGVIVAYDSTATVTDSATVALMNGAQRGARGLNLVNSADAMVANGLNIWAGNLTSATFEDAINVMQSNMLTQQFPGPVARVLGYYRDGEWMRDVHTSVTTNTPDTPDESFFPKLKPGHISGRVGLTIADIVEHNRTVWIPTNIIPTSKIPGGKTGGLAFAGDAFLHYDGGRVDLTATTGTHFYDSTIAGANGGASVFFGLGEGEGRMSYVENTHVDFTTNLVVGVDLPDLTIDVNGAGCIAKGTACTSGILEREDGPLAVDAAFAEYIVLDGSTLDATSDYSVALGESAQAEAEAVLMVNAAGGHVANGLNVSRLVANNLSAQPNTAQSNVVLQGVSLDRDVGPRCEDDTAAGGGAIVAGESTATLQRSASASLDANAQSDARALLFVNAADALVGNGLNVWHGGLDEADLGYAINLAQTNQVYQVAEQGVARLIGYDRDRSTLRHTLVDANSLAEPQYIRAAFGINIPDNPDPEVEDFISYYEGLNVPASAIPTSKIPGAQGIVTGFAGEVDVLYGGGSVDVLLEVDGHLGYNSWLSTDSSAGDFLGFGATEGSASFGIPEFSVDFEPTFRFTAELPTLQINAEGALCWANGGTCTASIREEDRGALNIVAAQAENIVVDRSVLDVTESYSVALDNGAQANAQAMAIVNAAGGLVANGINVSSLQGAALNTSTVNLVQRNVVVQKR